MENPKVMENTLASSSGTVSPEDQSKNKPTESKCPFNHGASAPTNRDWWPNQVNLKVLHQHSNLSDPMGEEFDYAREFKTLDLNAVIKDLHALMTDSQDWWPADFGHYGGFFIRMDLGQSKRRALSRFTLSGQLLSGAKRCWPAPAPPRPSPMRYVPALCQAIRIKNPP